MKSITVFHKLPEFYVKTEIGVYFYRYAYPVICIMKKDDFTKLHIMYSSLVYRINRCVPIIGNSMLVDSVFSVDDVNSSLLEFIDAYYFFSSKTELAKAKLKL